MIIWINWKVNLLICSENRSSCGPEWLCRRDQCKKPGCSYRIEHPLVDAAHTLQSGGSVLPRVPGRRGWSSRASHPKVPSWNSPAEWPQACVLCIPHLLDAVLRSIFKATCSLSAPVFFLWLHSTVSFLRLNPSHPDLILHIPETSVTQMYYFGWGWEWTGELRECPNKS